MEKLVELRLPAIISLVMGTGSWGFTQIITAPELKTWLITIAIAVSFLLSLIISLSLKGRPLGKGKIMRIAISLFIGFLFLIGAFFVFYEKSTIKIPVGFENGKIDSAIIVKGLSYTQRAKLYRDSVKNLDQFKSYPSDDKLLKDSTYDLQKVWDDSSRTYLRLILLFLYTIMIALFVAGVTFTAEWLTRYPAETAT